MATGVLHGGAVVGAHRLQRVGVLDVLDGELENGSFGIETGAGGIAQVQSKAVVVSR